MKQTLTIIVIICFLFACNSNKSSRKDDMTPFSMEDFVDIIRDSSFIKFKTIVNKPGYELDSSFSEKERIHYSADDTTSDDGDYLSVQMTKDRNIHFLNFSASNEKLYQQLERQVNEMGFTKLDDDLNVKEFTLEKVYLTIVIIRDEKSPSYVFALVRDDRKDTHK